MNKDIYINTITNEFMRFKKIHIGKIIIEPTGYYKWERYKLKDSFCKDIPLFSNGDSFPSILIIDDIYEDGDISTIYNSGKNSHPKYNFITWEDKNLNYYYEKLE